MSCTNNTLIIGRPNQGFMSSTTCSTSCSDSSGLGPTDPLDKSRLGPRKNRAKVKEQVRSYIILMLGGPTLDLELDEQAIDFCVEQAMMIFESYAPREYFSYYPFKI